MNATTAPPAEGSCPSNTPFITKQIIPMLYFVVFVAGILLNSMSGWVFFTPSSKSFIVYLKNIVIADFLMSLTFLKILGDLGLASGRYKSLCRVSAVPSTSTCTPASWFFGLIGFDRYKIVKPLFDFFHPVHKPQQTPVSAGVELTLLIAFPI